MLYYQESFYMCWVLFICKGSTSFYGKYKPARITQQKDHLLIWNSETTQNLNIYLHNYQTETAIFLVTKHEQTIMACSYLNFSNREYIKTAESCGFCDELLSKNDFEAVLTNFCWYEYIIVPMLLRQFRQKRRLAQGHC